MKVITDQEQKDFQIFKTPKFRLRVSDDWMEKAKEKENFVIRLITKIQKSMKPTAKYVTGAEWEESFRAIFKEITGEEFKIQEEDEDEE